MKQISFFLAYVCVGLSFSLNMAAQTAVPVLQFKASPAIAVFKPVLLDTTDVNRKAFEDKNLLQTSVDADVVRKSQSILTAAADSVLTLPTVAHYTAQLLAFNVDADRYCKAELIVTATDMLEVYVNGTHEKALLMQYEADYTKRPFFVNTLYELDLKTLQLDTLLTLTMRHPN
ncbi:hypothetical protein [Candidatus Symbiothrix dinenymphae]|uniref:hypothetical protein n=1 Tax=Candidatus Symbiothrix dinenymphae TaxID=467085 RepID=UPI0006C5FABE|nr:hypothetical protein [Candidatus Symbiothrix dinenymphae]GAP71446.1 acylaminoacyl-peptidase [Candidatus Symbiothrix dinenymphae]